MVFDPDRYEQEIIKPLRGKIQLPDGDLAARYAVEPGMSGPDLEARLRKVRMYWSNNATGPGNKAQACKLLLAADEDLRRREGAAMHDPAWWAARARQHGQQTREVVTRLAADLRKAYAGVTRISRDQLTAILEHVPALDPAQIDEAVRTAGLQVVDPVDLPTTSGLDRVAFRRLNERLGAIAAKTIVHLLHPSLTQPFRLVHRFEVPGDPRLALDRVLLEQRVQEAEAQADSAAVRARKEALGILRSGVNAGLDLRTIALYQVVERMQESANLPPALLLGVVTQLGVEQSDAEMLVLSLPSGSVATASPSDEIRDLLAEGQLRAAQQALAALPVDDPDAVAVRALVEANSAKVERLVREAGSAQTGGREDEAHRLLLEARNLAQDDPDIADRMQRVPIPAPGRLDAEEAGNSVQLGWAAPSSASASVTYRVVRTDGRKAASAQDGTAVTETAQLSCVDTKPPVARSLHYAVFASADGRIWSRPATSRVVVILPPVIGAQVRADPDRISGTWKAHPDLHAVRVRRTVGRPPTGPSDGMNIPATTTSFVDTGVDEGTTYHYAVIPVYRDERGRDIEGERVLLSGTPRARASAVTGLTAEAISAAANVVRVRLRWPRAGTNPVKIRYADRPPAWSEGTVVPAHDVDRYGTEVVGSAGRHGADDVLEADVPGGYHVFVPFALGGGGAVVGRAVGLGVADSVRSLEVRRTGTKATLSWVWPSEISVAEVVWAEPDGTSLTRRISRRQYESDGGVDLAVRPHGGVAAVRAIALGVLGEAFSPPSVVTIDALALRLGYRIERPGRLSNRPWLMRVTADNDCAGVDLSLVAAPGLVIPMRPDQGVIVQRFTGLTLAGRFPLELEFRPPRGMRPPYWIKCFVTQPTDVMVDDPPINEMKVD